MPLVFRSLSRKVSDVYPGIRSSRPLAVMILLVISPCWFVTRLEKYTDRVQNRRQQSMGGFGLMLSAATAPLRYFPWRGDLDAADRYDGAGDVFRDFRPFAGETFLPTGHVRTEKGILFPLRIASRLGAAASASTLVAIQLTLDLFVLFGLVWLLWSWGGPLAAGFGGLHYATSEAAAAASTFPFYYYWPVPFGVLLCIIATAAARRGRVAALSTAVGFGLTLGCWLLFRSTAVLVPLAIGGALLLAKIPVRRCLLTVAVVLGFELAPQVLLKAVAPAGEQVTLGRANLWHALYLGIGTRPNPYGIVFDDTYAYELVKRRYGIAFQAPGYEAALRHEYLAIARANPGLLIRNAVLNFWDGITGWSLPAMTWLDRHLWVFGALGIAVVLANRSEKTFPVLLAGVIWVVQCATLGLILLPQEGYLWETVAIRVLSGFAGIGVAVEWAIQWLAAAGGKSELLTNQAGTLP
jgi:hypothetical protein